ncbi:MAG: hypothetical protein ABFQ65_02900 [Nanoarchaeota archaeon]
MNKKTKSKTFTLRIEPELHFLAKQCEKTSSFKVTDFLRSQLDQYLKIASQSSSLILDKMKVCSKCKKTNPIEEMFFSHTILEEIEGDEGNNKESTDNKAYFEMSATKEQIKSFCKECNPNNDEVIAWSNIDEDDFKKGNPQDMGFKGFIEDINDGGSKLLEVSEGYMVILG